MLKKKLSLTKLISSLQDVIETGTGLRCYDEVPLNAPSPFYYAEIIEIRPENTKTMYVDVYTIMIHAIAEPSGKSIGVYNLITQLEEAMTKEICIGEPYWVLMQTSQGLANIQQDETNEKHAVLNYEIKISYGFKTK